MLAGNTGYHFQLLNAVIEVNELQKRRVVGKLQKHLGSLLGQRGSRCSASPSSRDTDDMREASSLVLAARLQGEGAEVVAYDPVAAGSGAAAARLGRARATRRSTPSTAPTRRCWSPSGPSSPSWTGARRRRGWRGR